MREGGGETKGGKERKWKERRRSVVRNMECPFEYGTKKKVHRNCTSAQQMLNTLKSLY